MCSRNCGRILSLPDAPARARSGRPCGLSGRGHAAGLAHAAPGTMSPRGSHSCAIKQGASSMLTQDGGRCGRPSYSPEECGAHSSMPFCSAAGVFGGIFFREPVRKAPEMLRNAKVAASLSPAPAPEKTSRSSVWRVNPRFTGEVSSCALLRPPGSRNSSRSDMP